jgi:hypothetical protein
MSKKAVVFDRLAMKETVAINRQMRSFSALNDEFQSVEKMRQTLQEMADETASKDGLQNAGTLRANAAMGHQIRTQLETAGNRCDYLQDELTHLRQQIAATGRRRDKSSEKARDIRRQTRDQREARREDDDASRRRPKSR